MNRAEVQGGAPAASFLSHLGFGWNKAGLGRLRITTSQVDWATLTDSMSSGEPHMILAVDIKCISKKLASPTFCSVCAY